MAFTLIVATKHAKCVWNFSCKCWGTQISSKHHKNGLGWGGVCVEKLYLYEHDPDQHSAAAARNVLFRAHFFSILSFCGYASQHKEFLESFYGQS
jgi:hypothetical protein